jgi:hypothetical protein
MTARNPWRHGIPFPRLWQHDTYRPYIAILLGEGFNDPPLRLNPAFRWQHLGVIAALIFVIGVVVYNVAKAANG